MLGRRIPGGNRRGARSDRQGCRLPDHPLRAAPRTRLFLAGHQPVAHRLVATVTKGARFTEADAEAHVHGIAFKTGPPERVGVELEWLVRDPRDPGQPGRGEKVTAPP